MCCIPTLTQTPPRVGDKEILTRETGTAGGKLQTGGTVQTAGQGRTGRMQRDGGDVDGDGEMELFLGGKDEDRGEERN